MKEMKKAVQSILLGLLASLFFAVTFVLNQLMSLSGGSWIWSASLRYLFMLPILWIILLFRRQQSGVFHEIKRHPWRWGLWSTVGFGLFYIPLCIAANYAPGWAVAACWQFTIIAGTLLVPFFRVNVVTPQGLRRVRQRIPVRGLLVSLIIFAGIVIVEVQQASHLTLRELWFGIIPVGVAAFAYPLGNRKMMELCQGRLTTIERVFGMTLASMPLWLLMVLVGALTVGLPHFKQVEQTFLVALSSGVVATVLFFAATDLTKGNVRQLAAVEATQSGEVVFTLLLSTIFISWRGPSLLSLAGIALIVLGMVFHSLWSEPSKKLSQLKDSENSASQEDSSNSLNLNARRP